MRFICVNSVQGDAPAYAEITQQASALTALLASSTPDKARLVPITAVWEKHLARANWDDKKSEINRNVANVLLANLCAAYLLAEDFAKVQQYGRLFAFRNSSGLFSKAWPAFQMENITNNPAAASTPPGSKAAKANTRKMDYLMYADGMLTH